jgi:hypothetical protein
MARPSWTNLPYAGFLFRSAAQASFKVQPDTSLAHSPFQLCKKRLRDADHLSQARLRQASPVMPEGRWRFGGAGRMGSPA